VQEMTAACTLSQWRLPPASSPLSSRGGTLELVFPFEHNPSGPPGRPIHLALLLFLSGRVVEPSGTPSAVVPLCFVSRPSELAFFPFPPTDNGLTSTWVFFLSPLFFFRTSVTSRDWPYRHHFFLLAWFYFSLTTFFPFLLDAYIFFLPDAMMKRYS